jgi:hypothetical protein
MHSKFERRPYKVSIGAYVAELVKCSLERERARELYSQILEEYGVERDRIYIKDNQRDVVAELRFKDNSDLYCDCDGSKNCVHIGYALSLPAVQRIVHERRNGAVSESR